MIRISFVSCVMLLISLTANAQGDQKILDAVEANAKTIFLDQASWTLPESFHNSGLAPSDKDRLIEQWADDSAACLVDALAKYAESTDVPVSELVDDDLTFGLEGGDSYDEFNVTLKTCSERAWAAIGASHEYD